MYEIRPYKEKDKAEVQRICLLNAGCIDKPLEKQRYILIMYCNYYIEQEPENCFVVTNEEDRAVGYIICSEDYEKYAETFNRVYIPQAQCLGNRQYMDAKLDMLSHALFKKKYPAHLHIDIDPEYQRIGAGSRLMNTLMEHLRTKGVHGLMLVVGTDNLRGRNFYKKNKFKELMVTKSGTAMAIEI
ncbi:MAG: GNAT family N-acetyltransferase [Oscillospiraceae bacterium]|nr:GNAT family N-acetyltransferase [Oscillospiraceae bacterium]